MTRPSASVTIKDQSDQSAVEHAVLTLPDGKVVPVVALADAFGHLLDSRPEYVAWFPPATNAANRSWADLFNASAQIVRVRGIWIVPTLSAVTGVQMGADINKTSSAGTGGTVVTPRPLDSGFPALDAGITARASAAGGAALAHLLWATYHFSEETNAGLMLLQHQNQIPSGLGSRVAEIVLRQNEGVQVKQNISGTAGLTGVLMYFVTDA